MRHFVTYNTSGEITGRYDVTDDAQLVNYPTRVEFDPASLEADFDFRYYVNVSSVALVEKNKVNIAVDSSIFFPDGAAAATLTFSSFTGTITCVVNGNSFYISAADNILVITSDIQAAFSTRVLGLTDWSREATVVASGK